MKASIRRLAALAAVATTTIASSMSAVAPASAGQFGQKEVDQTKFVAISSPYRGGTAHQLLIVEQVSDSRPCWSESGTQPTIVDPLLLKFDFTGVCSRSTDSNGYSIRVNGEDLGLNYSLRIVKQGDDTLLVGAPNDHSSKDIIVGRTHSAVSDFAKIELDPGWRFTKRVFGDRTLGHIYLTYEGATVPIADIDSSGSSVGGGAGSTPGPVATSPGAPGIPGAPQTPGTTARFRDTTSDIYLAEIDRAVQTGFITGFEDNTFRPTASLTREQLVSMVLGAIDSLPRVNLSVPAQVSSNPYSDVEASRWSAAKIQFARDNNIIKGYEDGTFRPSQPVTRAELMAVMHRTAEYAKGLQGQQAQLQSNRPAIAFTDTSAHWAGNLIGQMSSFCGVASPLNETGTSFAPDTAAQRNYAAAATLRMLTCVGGTPAQASAPQTGASQTGATQPRVPRTRAPQTSAPQAGTSQTGTSR
jgi:N-acetylmuramoyl-L-alanine amidase